MSDDHHAPDHKERKSVFISYSHEKSDSRHKQKVKELEQALVKEDLAVTLDQNEGIEPCDGWAVWSAKAQAANHIIVVLSEHYGKTQGSRFEAHLLAVLKQWDYPDHRVTQVFFDARYKDQEFMLKHGQAHLGGAVYDFSEGSVAESKRWASLVERTSADGASRAHKAPAGKEATQKKMKVERSKGIVLVGDIVDFSSDRYTATEQRGLMVNMWEWLQSHQTWKGWNLHLDSTLDGALVVFDLHDGESHETIELDALAFAQEWITFMQTGAGVISLANKHVGFRVGIEVGQYEMYDLPGDQQSKNKGFGSKIVGRGPNDCDRLTRLGGDSDVVVSETFIADLFKELNKAQSATWAEKFSPAFRPENIPLQAFPKAYRAQEFRLFIGHKPDKGEAMPAVLREIQAVTLLIHQTLEKVCSRFWEFLEEAVTKRLLENPKSLPGAGWDTALNRKLARLRVSLFLANPTEPDASLACSEFRVVDPDLSKAERDKVPTKSTTIYSIQDNGQGPAGRAFVTRKRFVLHDLPDPSTEWEKYVVRMADVDMDENACRIASRHARSFVCFPCALGNLIPAAVVCIDGMTSLEWLTKVELKQVAEKLHDRFGLELALLAKARR